MASTPTSHLGELGDGKVRKCVAARRRRRGPIAVEHRRLKQEGVLVGHVWRIVHGACTRRAWGARAAAHAGPIAGALAALVAARCVPRRGSSKFDEKFQPFFFLGLLFANTSVKRDGSLGKGGTHTPLLCYTYLVWSCHSKEALPDISDLGVVLWAMNNIDIYISAPYGDV